MRERRVEKRFVKLCKARGWMCLKFTSPGMAGVPDRIVLHGDGRVSFVELKRPGGKLSKLQRRVRKLFRKRGIHVHVIDTLEKVDRWVQ